MTRLIVFRTKALAVWVVAWMLAALSACTPPIPRPDQITVPAVGTLMPGGQEEGVQPNLPPEQGGALFINQTGLNLQVVVSGTIALIPPGQDFLFALPPGIYEFYVYQPDIAPRILKETLGSGKLRYLYIARIVPGGG